MDLVFRTLKLELGEGMFFQVGPSRMGVKQSVQILIVFLENVSQSPLRYAWNLICGNVTGIGMWGMQLGSDMQCAEEAVDFVQKVLWRLLKVVVACNVNLVSIE